MSTTQIPIFNVIFEPGCRNNWHIHNAEKGGGQILICVVGKGWYQEWGEELRLLQVGDVINIPAGVKYWYGATKDSWFSHLAMKYQEKINLLNGYFRYKIEGVIFYLK